MGQFLTEEAQPSTAATTPPSFAMARAFSCFRRQPQPTVRKGEPGGVFHGESTTEGGSTTRTDLEQTDHLSPFYSPNMTH